MSEERKRRIWPWVVALLPAVLVGYPLSIGPVEGLRHKRLRQQGIIPRSIWDTTDRLYAPLAWCYRKAPHRVRQGMDWYGKLWH